MLSLILFLKHSKTMLIIRERREIVLRVSIESVEQVSNFKYLGAIISEKMETIVFFDEVIWNTTVKVYVSTLTYGCESWVLSEMQRSWLQASEIMYLRQVGVKTGRDHIKKVNIRDELNVKPLNVKIEEQQLRWFKYLTKTILTDI